MTRFVICKFLSLSVDDEVVGNPNGWDDLEQTAVKLAGSDLLASLYFVRHSVKRTAVVQVAQSVYFTVLDLQCAGGIGGSNAACRQSFSA